MSLIIILLLLGAAIALIVLAFVFRFSKKKPNQNTALLGAAFCAIASVALYFLFPLQTPDDTKPSGIDNSNPMQASVMSYNIRLSSVDDGPDNWQLRKHATLEMIRSIEPDILGMQECMIEQMNYILDSLPQYSKVGVAREDGAERGEFSPVCYLNSRWEAIKEGTFWLSQTPETPSFGWDAACMRIVSWAKLRNISHPKKSIFVFNTHFDHRGDTARTESAKLLSARIKEIMGEDDALLPVFVTGDFNAQLSNPLFTPILANFADARSTCPISDSTSTTYHGWGKQNNSIIDHIFYRNSHPACYKVVTEHYGALHLSDHYPVWSLMQW